MKTSIPIFSKLLITILVTEFIFNDSAAAATLLVTAGQAVKINVTADGTQPFTYQWRKNGASISGATNSSFSITSATTADSANYSAIVTNAAGSTTSDDAALTVNAIASSSVVAPTITTQPASLVVTTGQTASFSVTAAGSATLTYQWLKNGVTISGATNANYSIATTTATDAALYSVIVTNSVGTATSTTATLTVDVDLGLVELTPSSFSARGENAPAEGIAQLFDGQITTKWLDFSATSWVQVTLPAPASLQAYGITSANDMPERDPVSWTLYGSNDGVIWTVIETRSAQSWSSRYLVRDFILATPSAIYSQFRFEFLATSGSTVQLAELELFGLTGAALPSAPSITSAPAALTVTAGQAASFSVTASGTATLSYQWRKNNAVILGATNSTYTISATTSADAADYSVLVSNFVGSASSTSAALTVNSAPTVLDLTPQSYSVRGQRSTTESAANLFDGIASTKWVDTSTSTWIKVSFASPTVLEAYSLTSANDTPTGDPSSWTLSGSNDGTNWTIIETRAAQTWATRLLTRDFVLSVPSGAFTQFRFDFKVTTGSITQIADLELFGNSVTSTKLTPSTYSARGQASTSVGIAKLFDNKTNTKWQDNCGITWAKITLPTATLLRRYTLTSAADTALRDPSSWTVSGSNDGVTWTIIDTRTSQTWSSRRQVRDFVLTNPTTRFTQYRFDFRVASGSITQLAELNVYGAP